MKDLKAKRKSILNINRITVEFKYDFWEGYNDEDEY